MGKSNSVENALPMATRPQQRRQYAKEPVVLFVEGYSDLIFYAEMLKHLGVHDRCYIHDLSGKDRTNQSLRDAAETFLNPANLEHIRAVAVLLDADKDPNAAFEKAVGGLKQAFPMLGITKPGRWYLCPDTAVRCGAWIAGGTKEEPEIESLAWEAWKAVPENNALAQCVEQYLNCAQGRDASLAEFRDKARIGAMLSVINHHDPRLGPGARAGKFPFDSPVFAELLAFLSQLKHFLPPAA